jgi:hypothetical protein
MYSFNFLECGGEIWHGKPSRRKWMLYKYNYDNYEARKENFKVEKIIFVSFHAEGVGTQRQSTVEGRFFSSPMRTWLLQIPHSISQAKPQSSGWLGAAGEFPFSIRPPNPGEAGVKAGDPFRNFDSCLKVSALSGRLTTCESSNRVPNQSRCMMVARSFEFLSAIPIPVLKPCRIVLMVLLRTTAGSVGAFRKQD